MHLYLYTYIYTYIYTALGDTKHDDWNMKDVEVAKIHLHTMEGWFWTGNKTFEDLGFE